MTVPKKSEAKKKKKHKNKTLYPADICLNSWFGNLHSDTWQVSVCSVYSSNKSWLCNVDAVSSPVRRRVTSARHLCSLLTYKLMRTKSWIHIKQDSDPFGLKSTSSHSLFLKRKCPWSPLKSHHWRRDFGFRFFHSIAVVHVCVL